MGGDGCGWWLESLWFCCCLSFRYVSFFVDWLLNRSSSHPFIPYPSFSVLQLQSAVSHAPCHNLFFSLFLLLCISLCRSLSFFLWLCPIVYSLFLSLPLFFCPYLSVSSPLSFSVSLCLSHSICLSLSLYRCLSVYLLSLSVSFLYVSAILFMFLSVRSFCLPLPLISIAGIYLSVTVFICMSLFLYLSISLSLYSVYMSLSMGQSLSLSSDPFKWLASVKCALTRKGCRTKRIVISWLNRPQRKDEMAPNKAGHLPWKNRHPLFFISCCGCWQYGSCCRNTNRTPELSSALKHFDRP